MTRLLLNDFYLQSFIDAQLSGEESARVWTAITESFALRKKHRDLVEQNNLLLRWWNSLTLREQGMELAGSPQA
jgi:hypothetical protein